MKKNLCPYFEPPTRNNFAICRLKRYCHCGGDNTNERCFYQVPTQKTE